MLNIFAVFLSYLLGAVPFGLLLGRLAGVDVRSSGSKNIGATNVTRLLGKKMGFFTLLLDIAKGFLPMLTAQLCGLPSLVVLVCGAAAFLGHCFPVYLGFKGGKGVATALGVFLFLDPVAMLAGLAVFVVLVAVWGYVSMGSLAAALVIPIFIGLQKGVGDIFYLAAFVALVIWAKHHENIRRLMSGTEKSFKKKGSSQ